MIILHVSTEEPEPDLEDELKDLVIQYQKEFHHKHDKALPIIEEDGAFYTSAAEIKKWLEQLKKELNWSRSLSGDGCFIDPENGNVC
jgi:hypothetical protein